MGETCSACNQKDSPNSELVADVHKLPSAKDTAPKE